MSTISNKPLALCDRSYKSQKLPESLTSPRTAQKKDNVHNALLVALSKANAIAIEKYKTLVGRGKVYWAYYVTKEGKKRATFLSPKEFQGYRWFDDFSTVINMKSGEVYQVSDKSCSCPSWEYQVKTGKKSQCKHQVMRSSLAGSGGDRSREIKVQINSFLQNNSLDIAAKSCNSDIKLNSPLPPAPCPPASSAPLLYNPSNRYKLNPEILLEGFELERSRDLTLKEYYLKAWSKLHLKAEPELKRIGRIIETDQGFMVGGMRGASRVTVAFQADAVGWLLRYNGIDYNNDILLAFQESQKSKKPCCHKCGAEFEIVLSWENEPDYCPNCGWVEKELSEIEKRRLAREEKRLNAAIAAKKQAAKKNSLVNVIEAFGGFL